MSKHTVTVSLEDEDYNALKALAEDEDRYINEQARHILRKVLTGRRLTEDFLADTHMAGASSAPETLDIRKFTGIVVPDEALVTGDDIKSPNTSKQEPLPG